MSEPIRAAVIGLGSMGRNHVRVLSEIAGVQLVGLADVDAAAAGRLSQQHGVAGFTAVDELLEDTRPQMVSIVVPTTLHEEVAIKAIKAGAHVLVEKPIAATVEAARRMAAAAEQAGVILTVGHIVRFNAAIDALKERLREGQGGRVLQVRARRVGPFPHRIRDVGVIHDLAPHDIDIMRYVLEDDVERVYAEAQRHINTDNEDLVAALLHFRGGAVGSLDINWLTPTKVRTLQVLCERGMFHIDYESQSLTFYENFAAQAREGTFASVTEGPMTRYPLPHQEPLRVELERFRDAIVNGGPAPVTAADGIAALAVSDALVESANLGQPVTIAAEIGA